MNLKDLAVKPQLIKITIDDAEVISEYGEALDFYTWDRQPMETFLKIAANRGGNFEDMAIVLKDMILDSEGQQVIKDGAVLPGKIMISAFSKLVDTLGK
jgi:hypothetical protein